MGGVAGGASAGKFHAWLSGIGAIATVIADVCVVVGT
jgi:hypothetical protein